MEAETVETETRRMIAILDYGMGNLKSVAAACAAVGAECLVTGDTREVAKADALILPGVGSFGAAVDNLVERDLIKPIRDHALAGKPVLGICLGMQLMLLKSEESPGYFGIHLVKGTNLRLPEKTLPHVGYATIDATDDASPLLDGLREQKFYFCHSYIADAPGRCVATSIIGDNIYPAAIRYQNIFGVQFHPEKSGEAGLQVFRQFRKMVEGVA